MRAGRIVHVLLEVEEPFDAREYLIQRPYFETWIEGRGYKMYNLDYVLWEKKWNNDGRVVVGRRNGTYMVARFSKNGGQSGRVEIDAKDTSRLQQAVLNFEQQAYPPQPPVEESEDFDAREYFTRSSLDDTAKRLGMEWLDWKVWYKEIGQWRLYIDPWKQEDWMEVEIGYDNTQNQAVMFDKMYLQSDAGDILPQLVNLLGSIETTFDQGNWAKRWPTGADEKVEALMSTFKQAVTDSQEDLSARKFFKLSSSRV